MVNRIKSKAFYIIAFLFVLSLILSDTSEEKDFQELVLNQIITDDIELQTNTEEISLTDSISTTSDTKVSNVSENESIIRAKVLTVVDGDTVKVSLNGRTETIRIIGINTPETVHPEKPVECFGREASAEAKRLLNDKEVTITYDASQGTYDKYGRTIAYINLPNGSDFGEVMIRSGFAYEYTYNLPHNRQAKYKMAETYARENKVGLWSDGACDNFEASPTTISKVSTNQNTNTSAITTTNNSSCSIKGNISNSGEKIYHTPEQQYYSRTVISEDKGERWFCSEKEAVEAGWRKALR